MQEKVYERRHGKPFPDIDSLRSKIIEVWDECASDLKSIRKAIKEFLPRLKAVRMKNGGSIKTMFG